MATIAKQTQIKSASLGRLRISKHSLLVAGHRTSISLEDAFWVALRHRAEARGMSVAALVAEIDSGRGLANLSSAIRVHLFEALAGSHTEEGEHVS